ncbi:hypothetical protein [Algirhabdus cladophorae]|uniref:hypothetical protein n=1 Tax=Algirhabdus cladophorae TaxID=3377108 RepID=UPI003B84928C
MTFGVLLPMFVLGTAAFLVPWWTVPRDTPHRRDVTRGILLAAFAMFCLAMATVALAFVLNGADLSYGFEASPLAVFAVFAQVALKSAIGWGPILAFMWVHLTTKANARAGELMAQQGEADT